MTYCFLPLLSSSSSLYRVSSCPLIPSAWPLARPAVTLRSPSCGCLSLSQSSRLCPWSSVSHGPHAAVSLSPRAPDCLPVSLRSPSCCCLSLSQSSRLSPWFSVSHGPHVSVSLSDAAALVPSGPLVLAPEEQQGAGGLPHADRPVLEGPATAHRRRLRTLRREVRLLQRYARCFGLMSQNRNACCECEMWNI